MSTASQPHAIKSTVSQPAVPIPQAGMSCLETLPATIFAMITAYLACFDKKALQVTSKKCRSCVGPVTCTHRILRTVYAYRSGLRSPSDSTAKADISEFFDLITDCSAKDSWIEMSQGQGARDEHRAFLNDWDSIAIFEVSEDYHPSTRAQPRDPRSLLQWQRELDFNSRCTTIQKIATRLDLRKPNTILMDSITEAKEIEGSVYIRAPDRTVYDAECRRISTVYTPPILQPYFHTASPKSTLAHLCYGTIIDFAKSVLVTQWPEIKADESTYQLIERLGWKYVSDDELPARLIERIQWEEIIKHAQARIRDIAVWAHIEGNRHQQMRNLAARMFHATFLKYSRF